MNCLMILLLSKNLKNLEKYILVIFNKKKQEKMKLKLSLKEIKLFLLKSRNQKLLLNFFKYFLVKLITKQ